MDIHTGNGNTLLNKRHRIFHLSRTHDKPSSYCSLSASNNISNKTILRPVYAGITGTISVISRINKKHNCVMYRAVLMTAIFLSKQLNLNIVLTHHCLAMQYQLLISITITSDNGLLPSDTDPLAVTLLTCLQWDRSTFSTVHTPKAYFNLHSQKS